MNKMIRSKIKSQIKKIEKEVKMKRVSMSNQIELEQN